MSSLPNCVQDTWNPHLPSPESLSLLSQVFALEGGYTQVCVHTGPKSGQVCMEVGPESPLSVGGHSDIARSQGWGEKRVVQGTHTAEPTAFKPDCPSR